MTELLKTSSTGRPVPLFGTRATKALPMRSEFQIRAVLATLVLATASLFYGQAHAAGDAAAGKTVFANQCASCHTTEVGKNGFGPSLAAVLGRKAGGLAG
jgi:cytochrome c2